MRSVENSGDNGIIWLTTNWLIQRMIKATIVPFYLILDTLSWPPMPSHKDLLRPRKPLLRSWRLCSWTMTNTSWATPKYSSELVSWVCLRSCVKIVCQPSFHSSRLTSVVIWWGGTTRNSRTRGKQMHMSWRCCNNGDLGIQLIMILCGNKYQPSWLQGTKFETGTAQSVEQREQISTKLTARNEVWNWDSSIGRASGFGPWDPGFESFLCQLSQKWLWAVTPAVASPYQG